MSTAPAASNPPRRKRANVEQITQALDMLCNSMQPGDIVPTHTELMRRFDASERAVLRALEELQRNGKIVRHQGKGTFIAERASQVQPVVPDVITDSQTIVAILRPDHSFFDQCLGVLFHQAKAAKLSVACRLVENGEDWSPAEFAAGQRPAGFIVFSSRLASIAHQLQADGCRVVVVGVPLSESTSEVPSVYGDQEQGGYLAMRHLIDLGHRRIAYCRFDGDSGLRGLGHQRALKEWNQQLGSGSAMRSRFGERSFGDKSPIEISEISETTFHSWVETPQLATEYFRFPQAPTGLLAWNDHQAMLILRTLLRAGVRVPEQVSLIGYDALPEGQMVYPSLSTLSTQIEQQVQVAVNLLTRSTPPSSSQAVVLVPTLVLGESTARAVSAWI